MQGQNNTTLAVKESGFGIYFAGLLLALGCVVFTTVNVVADNVTEENVTSEPTAVSVTEAVTQETATQETATQETVQQPAAAVEPAEYKAVYEADFKGLPISAKGIRELKQNDDGTYTLSSGASSFIAKLSESTRFKIEGDNFIPLHYEYHRSGIGANRDAVLEFDWQAKKVLNNVQKKPWTMDVPEGAMDKLLYQIKMRQDLITAHAASEDWPKLSYKIADGGRLKEYNFEVLGEEYIDTPVGKLNTIKVERIRANKNRTTIFWLSPKYDFMLVKFRQQKGDGSNFELRLKSAEFDGQDI